MRAGSPRTQAVMFSGAIGSDCGRSGATLEDQRAAILRMVADGRITPEEADLLLEALGTDQERPFRNDDRTGM